MSGLIWVQTVDKGYHQTTLVGNLKEINDNTGISSQSRALNFDLCLHLLPNFLYASNAGSGESLHLHRLS